MVFLRSLIISGVVHGVLFFLVLILNKKYKNTSNYYIALVVLFLSLNNLYYWLINSYEENLLFLENLYAPWALLILPCFYLFVQSFLNKKLEKKYLFIPFYFFLIGHSIVLLDSFFLGKVISEKTKDIFFSLEEYIIVFFSIYIVIKTKVIIHNYERNSKEKLKKNITWLQRLLVIGVCFFLFLLLISLLTLIIDPVLLEYARYFLWIGLTFLIYLVAYLSVYHNIIYKQRNIIRKTIKKETSKKEDHLVEDIKNSIKVEKWYLEKDISLSLLSKKFNLSESYISHVFNQESTSNFMTFVNELRIEEAKKMLLNKEFSNYTIVAVGLESGFNSKSAFYKAFKKETMMTPSEFKKKNLS